MKFKINQSKFTSLSTAEAQDVTGGVLMEFVIVAACICGCLSSANGGPVKKCTAKVNTSSGSN